MFGSSTSYHHLPDVTSLPSASLPSPPTTPHIQRPQIASVDFAQFRLLYVPSSSKQTKGGVQNAQNDALMERAADIKNYVNVLGGSLVVLTQAGLRSPYGFFPLALEFTFAEFSEVTVTDDMQGISPATTSASLKHSYWHGYFTGPRDWAGIYRVLAFKAYKNDKRKQDGIGCPVMNGGCGVVGGGRRGGSVEEWGEGAGG